MGKSGVFGVEGDKENEVGLAFGVVLAKSLGYEIICEGWGFVGRGCLFGDGLECWRREFV